MTSWILAAAILAAQADLTPAQLEEELTAYRRLLLDWGSLTRYGSDNSELKPPKAGENRVVFLGDDNTERWGEGEVPFFPGKPYLNRGITRQTAPQMLVRFRQDVIALQPKVVVIQAGSNDLASVTGPMTMATIADYYETMVELAKAHGIKVVIASVTPVCDCSSKEKITMRRAPAKIANLNEFLEEFATRTGSVYLDYYSALADGRTIRKEYTVDGFLLSDAAFRVMAPLAEKAIAQALALP
jgi:lysophospholipase L1-like esterase